MSSVKVRPDQQRFYQEFIELTRKYAATLRPIEVLALTANLVGKLIALQDQRKYTAEQIMEMIGDNIAQGNAEATKELDEPKGTA